MHLVVGLCERKGRACLVDPRRQLKSLVGKLYRARTESWEAGTQEAGTQTTSDTFGGKQALRYRYAHSEPPHNPHRQALLEQNALSNKR
eukprot:55472-Eustigmatos_ZCMA.PRE.1